MKPYSQFRAMLAITKGSLHAIFRSPSAVIFGFFFPLIFILVFGFIGGSGISIRVALKNPADTSNVLIKNGLVNNPSIRLITDLSEDQARSDVAKGRIAAILEVDSTMTEKGPQYILRTTTSSASIDKFPVLKAMLDAIIARADERMNPGHYSIARLESNPDIPGRVYRTIDFILPGQLGFSLLSSGVFGVAFMFFGLRNTLVLKRFFATPIRRSYIILGEGLSRVIFSLITAVVILLVGRFIFHFTLVHGVRTFMELLVLSFIGLMVFMGFGFIISGLAKNDSTIPPLANIITLPQFLLAGTFFSIDVFPKWLQPISRALPLTYLNTAMRNVAFEGQTLWDVKGEIGILLIWGVIAYAIAIKVFKWE